MHRRWISFAVLTFLGSLQAEPASAPTPVESPAAAENPALAGVEFTGVFSMGGKASFCITDASTRSTFWIDLGQTVEGLTAAAWDAKTSVLTIKGRGGQRALHLKETRILEGRTPAAPVATPTPPPPPAPAPPPPPRPLTIAEQLPANLTPQQREQRTAEIEARMLVSDLMEIGMQERQRYQEEEQRRRAAAPAPAPAPPPGR